MASEALNLLLLLGLFIGLTIARRVQRGWQQTFLRYAGERAACGLPGHAVARHLLDALGLSQVAVVHISGFSRYRPWRGQVCLGGAAFEDSSLSALVVAVHEVGHAQQFAAGYLPARIWRFLQPLLYLLVVAGFALLAVDVTGPAPISYGLVALLPAFVVSLLLMLDLLLLEYDATRRAKELVQQAGLIAPGEQRGFNLLSNCGLRMHIGRASCLVAAGVVLGLMYLLTNADWLADAPAVPDAPRISAPLASSPPAAMPEGSQDVLNVELDVTTPLLWSAGIVALWSLLPISRQIRARMACKRCTAGVTFQNQGALEAAIVEYNEAVRLDRKLVAAYVGRGTALLLLGRLDKALADLETANRLTPGVAGLLVARGTIHLRRDDFERALADLNEALCLVPDSTQALVARGNLWLLRQDLERAAADFERAIASNPNDLAALQARCQLRLTRNELDGALEDIDRAFARGGHDANWHVLRGKIWMARKEFDLALTDFQVAIQLAPSRADLFRDRGLVWLFQGDFERAIADESHAIRLNPDDAVAFNNRGYALLKIGKYAQAVADLREAIRIHPSLPNPYRHLAWLQSTCPAPEFRNGDEAVANATRALELAQWKPVDWLATLAAAHAEAANFAEARRWQTKCLDESPREAMAELRTRLELYEADEPLREQPVGGVNQSLKYTLPLTSSSDCTTSPRS